MSERAPFDRAAVRRNRLRSAAAGHAGAFLFNEVAARVADRLLDVRRQFPVAVDFSGRGDLGAYLEAAGATSARGIECLLRLVESPAFGGPATVVGDQEVLPFGEASIDLALSVLALHTVNDLPGTLVQTRHALRPDGLFLAAFFGGKTLWELRACLGAAEIEVTGGISPRVIPFADLRDIGGLLQRTGFALPVTDQDRITVTYASLTALMRDLRLMGEANPLAARPRSFLSRKVLARAEQLYRDQHASEDGRIPATFDVTYLTGWAPHDSQQKPLRPGGAKARLADALDTTEQSAGEKTGPAKPQR